jgi:hypothetical protein
MFDHNVSDYTRFWYNTVMENSELLASNEIIDDSCTPEQEDAFRDAIENLEDEDLVAINDYLNAGVEVDSDWHDYWDAFAKYEWSEFVYAYHHVMSRDFSLD